jgi:hypothetical protein
MAKATCYQPVISRALIAALFHEAKRRRQPMTRLVDGLLRDCLHGTPGWETAAHEWPELNSTLPRSTGLREIPSKPLTHETHGSHPHQ